MMPKLTTVHDVVKEGECAVWLLQERGVEPANCLTLIPLHKQEALYLRIADKMSPGMRLRLAIELSDFAQRLKSDVALYG